MTKTAIIGISDLHVNSTVAICPPTVNLDDGGTYHASRTQMWLWRSWLDYIRQAEIDTQGMRRVLVVNGDLGELDTQKRSIQLMTLNKATILRMVWDVLDPIAQNVDRMLFIRGTSAHTGKSSWLEEAIANDTSIAIRQSDDIASHYHYRGVCEGVKLDLCHHASKSLNPFTSGYGAIRVAARMQRYYQKLKATPPDVAMRSHNHTYEDSGGNYETFVFFTQAWTTANEFSYRIGQENGLADIGGHVLFCENGKFQHKRYQFEPKEARQVWKLTL